MPLGETVSQRAGSPRRVLLVDDHPSVLEQIEDLLRPEFEIVGTARSGAAMIAAALQWRPEVIVADIAMPVMDGIEAARRLQNLAFYSALVFVSMNGEAELVREALAVGAAAYVLKLRAGTELIPAIRAALEGRRFISPDIERGRKV